MASLEPVAPGLPPAVSESAPSPPADEGAGLAVLALFTLAVFGFATAVTMVAPLLVDLGHDLGITVAQAGLLAAAMATTWALGAPFAGILSDRFGRRPMIVLALVGLGVVNTIAALAPGFGVLLVARLFAGVFGGFGPASVMAAAGDLFPPHRRGMAMGWLNMGFSLAAVLGTPAIGAIGGLFGWRWAFAACGLLLVGLGALIYLTFPASRVRPAEGSIMATYRAVLGVPRLGSVLGANLVERAVFNLGVLYLPAFLMVSYGLDAVGVAPTLMFVAIGNVLGNIAGGWLGDRLPKASVFVVAQIATGLVGLALFTLSPGLALSALGGALFGLVNASSRPSLLALGAELSARHRGAVLGLLSLTNQGGIVLGSTLGGLALGVAGFPAIAGLTVGAGVLAALLALPLTPALVRRSPRDDPNIP
ncbi:MAG: MFS transporter [Chloroflexi bacterium]|nr:MFS transporter [Chloroflexota bacterium]